MEVNKILKGLGSLALIIAGGAVAVKAAHKYKEQKDSKSLTKQNARVSFTVTSTSLLSNQNLKKVAIISGVAFLSGSIIASMFLAEKHKATLDAFQNKYDEDLDDSYSDGYKKGHIKALYEILYSNFPDEGIIFNEKENSIDLKGNLEIHKFVDNLLKESLINDAGKISNNSSN